MPLRKSVPPRRIWLCTCHFYIIYYFEVIGKKLNGKSICSIKWKRISAGQEGTRLPHYIYQQNIMKTRSDAYPRFPAVIHTYMIP